MDELEDIATKSVHADYIGSFTGYGNGIFSYLISTGQIVIMIAEEIVEKCPTMNKTAERKEDNAC